MGISGNTMPISQPATAPPLLAKPAATTKPAAKRTAASKKPKQKTK